MPTLESVENFEFGKVQILEGGRGGPFELIPSSEILKGEREMVDTKLLPPPRRRGHRETERQKERDTMAVAGGGLAKGLARGPHKELVEGQIKEQAKGLANGPTEGLVKGLAKGLAKWRATGTS